jgi:uncharacterized protein (DUF111 family)
MGFLVIDPLCGMAGDMFCAALLDLGVEEDGMLAVMRKAAVFLGGGEIRVRGLERYGTRGKLLSCEYPAQTASVDSETLRQGLLRVCAETGILGRYGEFAERAFSILEQAEQAAHAKLEKHAAGHGVPHRHVHLHEAQDILVDIAGSAWGLQRLRVDLDHVKALSPVMVGGGEVRFSHGRFTVPAPAVAEVIALYRIPTAPGPHQTELFTPTGAALLAALNPEYGKRAGTAAGSGNAIPAAARRGVGFGTKILPHKQGDPAAALYLYYRNG